MLEKLEKLISDMNSKGIPVPMARDPKTGVGSITATMVVVSFGVCLILLAGKVTKVIGSVDYDNALWLLGLALSAYLGRQFQKNGKQGSLGGLPGGLGQTTSSEPQENDDAGASK